jgi:putative colanic acid biosynthesis acetyltransferase WcaF
MHNSDTFSGPSFSLKNRIGRLVWGITSIIFFRYSPKPFFSWRSFLLRSFGAKTGNRIHIYPGVKIWAPWNLVLGDECGVANGAILYSQGKITIGKRAVISQGAHLVAGTHDFTKSGFPVVTKPISVGDNAWVAAEAFIHPGVNIGQGCVVGARAVVTQDMPEWMICAGHPCIPIKERKME